MNTIKEQWFGNVRGDILAGIVVALALIPEAIAFSIIAGVDPMVGLYASFIIAVVIAFVGGRAGMISGATGAMALLMIPLIAQYGLEYLLAATILTGILQILFGVLKLARYMKFIPRSVMVGFVNALAILIFEAQIPHLFGQGWLVLGLAGATLAIIYLFPYISKVIPSTLVAIVIITGYTMFTGLNVFTVGNMGALPETLPIFLIPNVPLSYETLAIIFPFALALTVVGILESLLTATIVDDMTDTGSNKNRESRGQGIANIVTGFFGGMAGCAMIGQSVINVKSGGRGRLSSLVSGIVLILLILLLGNIVVQIPMAALAGVMVMVSISTFDWNSLRTLLIVPATDSIVMVVTVVTVVLTHDLSKGVFAGILLSAIFFVSKISKISIKSELDTNKKKRTYFIKGQLFFASVTEPIAEFDFKEELNEVVLDFTHAHIWDDSAVAAMEKIITKFEDNGTDVEVTGLNEASTLLVDKLRHKLSSH
ncbi:MULTISPECIES: SulP family inorganic anion transporter [Bacillaceae]|uniref:SulP family inorganic anion transporter n=1 Tax=Evansella alkalicola TaxID=745819 RepID=A0ABS6JYJ3_9BACI|nr:SulP family inorganic anion transporter [Litchfieldia alkalitelluris]MBU9723662.1 SulP family inorganic anion transporter [Bacillus alkalicola]